MFDCGGGGPRGLFRAGRGSPRRPVSNIGSGEAADIGASRRSGHSNPALSGTYPCPSRLGQTWIGNRPLRCGRFSLRLGRGRFSLWLACGRFSLWLACGRFSLRLACGRFSLRLACGRFSLRLARRGRGPSPQHACAWVLWVGVRLGARVLRGRAPAPAALSQWLTEGALGQVRLTRVGHGGIRDYVDEGGVAGLEGALQCRAQLAWGSDEFAVAAEGLSDLVVASFGAEVGG